PLSVDEQLPRGGRELLDDPVDGDSHEVPHLLHIGSHNETTRVGPSQGGVSKGRVHVARARCHPANEACRAARTRKPNPRSQRHHQHHDPGTPRRQERYETPDPLRSNALKSRIQCVLTGPPCLTAWYGRCWSDESCCRVHIAAHPVPQGTDLSRPARSSSGHGGRDGMVGG